MDSNFTIKPRPGVQGYAPRDPVPVREAAETGSKAVKPAGAPGDQEHREQHREQRHEHHPHDVVADPESREVINRENDVRAQADGREHPDQALLRQRAYRAPLAESDSSPPAEPHANIKA